MARQTSKSFRKESEEQTMQCPYCKSEMKKRIIFGDARYSLTKFEIESYYCEKCKKMIFDTEIRNC